MGRLSAKSRLASWSIQLLSLVSATCSAAPIVVSDFSSGDEAWLVTGDVTSAVPEYIGAGGNPGGFLRATDQAVGGVWTWDAPAKFLGDRSVSYGYSLTYDLRMRGSGPLFNDSDVILTGSGLALYLAQTPPVPADVAWTSYTALLSETANWRVGSLAGAAATKENVQSVLASLTRLQIRGEFISGSDNGDLDNVVLNGPVVVDDFGDFNHDGMVDGYDFLVWQRGESPHPLSSGDLEIWKTHFGSAGTALSLPVPEPAAIALLAMATCVGVVARQRRRR